MPTPTQTIRAGNRVGVVLAVGPRPDGIVRFSASGFDSTVRQLIRQPEFRSGAAIGGGRVSFLFAGDARVAFSESQFRGRLVDAMGGHPFGVVLLKATTADRLENVLRAAAELSTRPINLAVAGATNAVDSARQSVDKLLTGAVDVLGGAAILYPIMMIAAFILIGIAIVKLGPVLAQVLT